MWWIGLLLVSISAGGCAWGPRSALTAKMLMDAEYQCEWAAPSTIQLKDGFFWKRLVPRSAMELRVVLTEYAAGELNGDGAFDAAVVLVVEPGGSGRFRYLAAVVNENGRPRNVATVLLGDRVQVLDLAIREGAIAVDLLDHGADDPMPFPSVETRWIYRLEEEALVKEE